MKKKLISLLLAFTMVFTMSIPSFAATEESSSEKLKYVAIGDSVGFGFGLDGQYAAANFVGDEYFNIETPKEKYDKNAHLVKQYRLDDGVQGAYPALLANKLGSTDNLTDFDGIDMENSFNATYDGLRAKDFCYILGLLSKAEEDQFYSGLYYSEDNIEYAPLDEKFFTLYGSYTPKTEGWGWWAKKVQVDCPLGENQKADVYVDRTDDTKQMYFIDLRQDIYTKIMSPLQALATFDWNTWDSLLMLEDFCVEKMRVYVAEKLEISLQQADLITVELGLNDINNLFQTDMADIISEILQSLNNAGIDTSSLSGILKGTGYDFFEDSIKAGKVNTKKMDALKKALEVLLDSGTDMSAKQQAFLDFLNAAGSMGADIGSALGTALDMVHNTSADTKTYLNRLVKHIRKINPSAEIVLVSCYNPLTGMVSQTLGSDEIDIGKVVATPLVLKENAIIMSIASKYNCAYADVSKVKPGLPVSTYNLHPDEEGQAQMADIIYSTIKDHADMSEYGVLSSLLLTIGDILGLDSDTESVILKLIKGEKSFKVAWADENYGKARTKGYQIQYSQSRYFLFGNKTVTINPSDSINEYKGAYYDYIYSNWGGAKTYIDERVLGFEKEITGLKALRRYYVRVRSFTTDASGRKVYSDWSSVKAVTTKAISNSTPESTAESVTEAPVEEVQIVEPEVEKEVVQEEQIQEELAQ